MRISSRCGKSTERLTYVNFLSLPVCDRSEREFQTGRAEFTTANLERLGQHGEDFRGAFDRSVCGLLPGAILGLAVSASGAMACTDAPVASCWGPDDFNFVALSPYPPTYLSGRRRFSTPRLQTRCSSPPIMYFSSMLQNLLVPMTSI